tara:strand:+ start:161 stop:418 length:258 start_codon:yes stop_codon:yes gene_type:complete
MVLLLISEYLRTTKYFVCIGESHQVGKLYRVWDKLAITQSFIKKFVNINLYITMHSDTVFLPLEMIHSINTEFIGKNIKQDFYLL